MTIFPDNHDCSIAKFYYLFRLAVQDSYPLEIFYSLPKSNTTGIIDTKFSQIQSFFIARLQGKLYNPYLMEMDVAGIVAQWIEQSNKIVILTGEELSSESGLPDFLDSGVNPHIRDFRENKDIKAKYWKQIKEVYPSIINAEPSPSHQALTELEMISGLDCIFTQAMYGLHHKAGSSNVIELNSSILWVNCMSCGKDYTTDEILSMIERGDEIPKCTECGSEQLKPPLSFPGQPPPHWEAREAWIRLHNADLFIIAGASLEHEPVASYPFLAKERDIKVVIISENQSPADDHVDAVIYGKPSQVLPYIVGKIKEGITIT